MKTQMRPFKGLGVLGLLNRESRGRYWVETLVKFIVLSVMSN